MVNRIVPCGGCDRVIESVGAEEVEEGWWWVEEVDVDVALDGDGGVGGGGIDVVNQLLETRVEQVELVALGAAVDIDDGVFRVVLVFVGVKLDSECPGVVDEVVGGGKGGGVEGLACVD